VTAPEVSKKKAQGDDVKGAGKKKKKKKKSEEPKYDIERISKD